MWFPSHPSAKPTKKKRKLILKSISKVDRWEIMGRLRGTWTVLKSVFVWHSQAAKAKSNVLWQILPKWWGYLRLGTFAVLGSQRAHCGMYASTFSSFVLSQVLWCRSPVHRVMWESPLSFLGTFRPCHSEENMKRVFLPFKPLNLCVSKIWNKFSEVWGMVDWLLTCDFWALKGAAALLLPFLCGCWLL